MSRQLTGHVPKTILTQEQETTLIVELAAKRIPQYKLAKLFKIGIQRLDNFVTENEKQILKIRKELNIKRDEELALKAGEVSNQIIESIDDKDIKKASLGVKTSSFSELVKTRRLLNNQSTENTEINISGMTKDELLQYINNDEKTDLNASNP